MASDQQINRLPGLLAVKMIWQQISLSNRLTRQSPTRSDQGRQRRTRDEHSGLKSLPPLMRGLDVHENIDVSDTKLMLGLRVCFISSDLTVNKLFPIIIIINNNKRAVTGPPKMSLLLEVESTTSSRSCFHRIDRRTKAYPCYAYGWSWWVHNVQPAGKEYNPYIRC